MVVAISTKFLNDEMLKSVLEGLIV
jgi:hypothetical protein